MLLQYMWQMDRLTIHQMGCEELADTGIITLEVRAQWMVTVGMEGWYLVGKVRLEGVRFASFGFGWLPQLVLLSCSLYCFPQILCWFPPRLPVLISWSGRYAQEASGTLYEPHCASPISNSKSDATSHPCSDMATPYHFPFE